MSRRDPKVLQVEISRTEARLAELDNERRHVWRHLSALKAELSSVQRAEDPRQPPQQTELPTRVAPMTSAEKVALFMALFRGRADVYPKRWVNPKKNTQGYSPACGNEWAPGLCDKPKVKCSECPNQAFIPVTQNTIHDHFQGRHVIGVYPMLPDETCWFLRGSTRVGQDCRRCEPGCAQKTKHAGAGSPDSAPRTVDCPAFTIPGLEAQGNRPDRRRQTQAERESGCRHVPEPCPRGRGG